MFFSKKFYEENQFLYDKATFLFNKATKRVIILPKTKYVSGRVHDCEIFKRTPPPIPPRVGADMDRAYKGIEKGSYI